MLYEMLKPDLGKAPIVINTSEFAATQINAVWQTVQLWPTNFAKWPSGMNEVRTAHQDLRVMNLALVEWTLRQALELLIAARRDGKVCSAVEMIVNDFVLTPPERAQIKANIGLYIPPLFSQIIAENGLKLSSTKGSGLVTIECPDGVRVPVNFVFESWLRNQAKKMIERLSVGAELGVSGGDKFVCTGRASDADETWPRSARGVILGRVLSHSSTRDDHQHCRLLQ
jgi:hypothetical protein